MSCIIRVRRDTAANWTSTNPVLALGEQGLETDTRKVKYGDGTTTWNSLGYPDAGGGASEINDLTDAVADNSSKYNIFLGTDAGGTTPLGSYNVALGQNALSGVSTSTADENVAMGYNALAANTTGKRNTAVGCNTLAKSTGENLNSAFGFDALAENTDGYNNTAIGEACLEDNINGNQNTAVGAAALYNCISGSANIGIGAATGGNITTGSSNILIGMTANVSVGSATGRIVIGNYANCTANNTWVIGTIGKKQAIVEGSNAAMGLATLSGGTVTVTNTLVTANSRIFITAQADGGTPGAVRVSGRSVGTNFVITSSSGTDTSTVAWEIKEPN